MPTLKVAPLALVVAVCTASAQRPVKVDDFARFQEVRDPRVSPDGEWILYTLTSTDVAANKRDSGLWVIKWDGSQDHRLTWSAEGESSAKWSPNGKYISFLSTPSQAAMQVAARHIDLYLTWGEPPQDVADKIARVRKLAGNEGRELRFGIRLHVIVRDTVAEARRDAEKLIEHVTPEIVAQGQKTLAKYESDGQRRMLELQSGGQDGL